MISEKSLLIAVDGTAVSAWMMRRARALISSLGTTVTLLRVIECREAEARSVVYRGDSRHRPAFENLAELRDAILGYGAVVRAELRFGTPDIEILREITESRPDFVVMSTHARVGIAKVFLGSITERVLRSSPVPLVLFRPLLGSGETLSPVEDFNPARFENLMVALDGSPDADEVLPGALEIARALGSRLHFFRAIPAGSQETRGMKEAGADLRGLQKLLADQGIPSEISIRTGSAAAEALAVIRERKVDSVALTTRGHTGIARAIYGSVAWEIIRDAGVPMLLLTNRAMRLPLPEPAGDARRVLIDG